MSNIISQEELSWCFLAKRQKEKERIVLVHLFINVILFNAPYFKCEILLFVKIEVKHCKMRNCLLFVSFVLFEACQGEGWVHNGGISPLSRFSTQRKGILKAKDQHYQEDLFSNLLTAKCSIVQRNLKMNWFPD